MPFFTKKTSDIMESIMHYNYLNITLRASNIQILSIFCLFPKKKEVQILRLDESEINFRYPKNNNTNPK